MLVIKVKMMSYNSILGERGHLSEQILKSSQGSTVSCIVGLAEYLANTIPIISSSLESLFERYSKNTFITKKIEKNNSLSKFYNDDYNKKQYLNKLYRFKIAFVNVQNVKHKNIDGDFCPPRAFFLLNEFGVRSPWWKALLFFSDSSRNH
ncbi:hypothetical protein H8356DRAFT_1332174 [Neocallimastix lanati (nom. inval.)]|nr:hypothetical protein H8356DRAFT_1332174 [Neocallimastix sp. JGI-2020a]